MHRFVGIDEARRLIKDQWIVVHKILLVFAKESQRATMSNAMLGLQVALSGQQTRYQANLLVSTNYATLFDFKILRAASMPSRIS